jgi:hypothetical protein
MGELNQLMLEHEEFLEKALDDMEFSNEFMSQEQVDCIRQACGKPRNDHVNPVLRDVINDFGKIFGNPLESFPSIRGAK